MTHLIDSFQTTFQTTETPDIFFAPGRINLIGEHTDYNGGHVFPATISYGTYALARKRHDNHVRFYSANFPDSGIITVSLADLTYKQEHAWANYPKGMMQYMQKAGHAIQTGLDIFYYGNIPNSAGLSSSASIEMVTGVLLEEMFQFDIKRMDMVRIGQQVENKYMGVQSGIMDQFAVGMGQKDSAMLLDCRTLDYHYASLELEKHAIIIMNTNKSRALESSKYNERRTQCEEALADLQKELPISALGDVTPEQFEKHQGLIQNATNRKRAKHAIYENNRTIQAHSLLEKGDLEEFGELMNASHTSLQKDYEVTGAELDTIVEAAWNQPGVIGARMTGAGFGGCAIAIVENDRIDSFKKEVNTIYKQAIGYDATFYTATIGDGAKKVEKTANDVML